MSVLSANRVEVRIDGSSHLDVQELARLSRRLCDELLELNVEKVDYATAVAPPGAKSGSAVSLGTIIVTLSDSVVLAALVGLLRGWVQQHSGRKLRVRIGENELEIKGALGEREDRRIEEFLDLCARNQADAGASPALRPGKPKHEEKPVRSRRWRI
jgi:hypothetical protein